MSETQMFISCVLIVVVVGDVALKYVSCKNKKEREENE